MNSTKKLSKRGIIGIIGVIIVVAIIAYFLIASKGISGTYSHTESEFGGKETDTIVFKGKKYTETLTQIDKSILTNEKTKSVKHYSGTFNVKDDQVTFSGDNANGSTAKLSKDKNVLTIQNGQQLTKKQ